ncbi:reverse transcriptase domain-containing protein [Tanacetum coccineum]
MDHGSRNGLPANEKVDSRIAYDDRATRKRRINHLLGSSKRGHQCRPDDGEGREANTHLFRQPSTARSRNQLHSNGKASTRSNGSGAGLILINPEGMEFTYALRFRFDATNNKAEYEALIAGLKIA